MYHKFDNESLSREYSPSSCVDDITQYINQYITRSKQALTNAKTNNSVIENIYYGNNDAQVLDLFIPFDTKKSSNKLHVYIHGGYWQELSKNESCFAATNFQNHGHHFAVVNYSLAPNATLSEIVEENRQAIAWLYNNAHQYGYSCDDIYLSGSSAGAHLAMMMALTDWSKYLNVSTNIIKGICAVSGIYDLTPIVQTYINDPLQLTPDEIRNNSPLLMSITKQQLQHCKFIFAYGDNETSEFKRQTHEIIDRLDSLGIPSTFSEITNRNHFDVIVDLANPQSWLGQQVIKWAD